MPIIEVATNYFFPFWLGIEPNLILLLNLHSFMLTTNKKKIKSEAHLIIKKECLAKKKKKFLLNSNFVKSVVKAIY